MLCDVLNVLGQEYAWPQTVEPRKLVQHQWLTRPTIYLQKCESRMSQSSTTDGRLDCRSVHEIGSIMSKKSPKIAIEIYESTMI